MRAHHTIARVTLTLAWCLCAQAAMYACPICFQFEDAHVTNGIRAAVGVLMAVTGVVLVGVVRFATRVARNQ